jgi:hypothetical protein
VCLPGRVRGGREFRVAELAGMEPAGLAERPDRGDKFRAGLKVRARRLDQVVPAALALVRVDAASNRRVIRSPERATVRTSGPGR